MSDDSRTMIDQHKSLLQSLDEFCFGNGRTGANKRIDYLEDIVNGKQECRAMKEVNDHLAWHDKMSGRRWEVTIGLILVVLGQAVSMYMIARGMQ